MRLIDADALANRLTQMWEYVQQGNDPYYQAEMNALREAIEAVGQAKTVVRDGMNKFNQNWADTLRAGALEVAENAEKIVGDLEKGIELTVSIHLFTDTEEINFPYISIHRKIGSAPMNKAKFEYYKREKQ